MLQCRKRVTLNWVYITLKEKKGYKTQLYSLHTNPDECGADSYQSANGITGLKRFQTCTCHLGLVQGASWTKFGLDGNEDPNYSFFGQISAIQSLPLMLILGRRARKFGQSTCEETVRTLILSLPVHFFETSKGERMHSNGFLWVQTFSQIIFYLHHKYIYHSFFYIFNYFFIIYTSHTFFIILFPT